jgi:hypothetical protein
MAMPKSIYNRNQRITSELLARNRRKSDIKKRNVNDV